VSVTSAGSAIVDSSTPSTAPGDCQHESFGKKLHDQLPRRRAHCEAHRDFALTRERTGQKERCHVERANEHDEADGADQDQQRRLVVAQLLIEQRDQSRYPTSVALRKFLGQSHAHSVDSCRRLIERGVLLHTDDRFHEMRESRVLRQVPLQPLPHVDVIRIVEARWHDAGDGVRLSVQTHLTANDRAV
jgi:hypothetical protein